MGVPSNKQVTEVPRNRGRMLSLLSGKQQHNRHCFRWSTKMDVFVLVITSVQHHVFVQICPKDHAGFKLSTVDFIRHTYRIIGSDYFSFRCLTKLWENTINGKIGPF